jgi:hypothetical protein
MEKSRQVQRAEFRSEVRRGMRITAQRNRKDRQAALLERQTAREKAGAYTGRSTASSVAASRSRITKRKVKKGTPLGRIIAKYEIGNREIYLHATKGWRSRAA